VPEGRGAAVAGAPAATPVEGPAATPRIDVEGLERAYGERLALDGVSFRVAPGETLSVLGANGAGKSTLLRVLATLLRPHAGRVRVLGEALPDEAWRVRGRVGYVGHEPLLYRDLSGRENLLFHARLHRVSASRVDELLDAIGLSGRGSDLLRELSRGTVQRLATARAVLHDPELLLLDEPRAGLDPAAADLLEPLAGRASGRTRVVVTHDVEAALAESDRVLGIRRGRVALLEPVDGLDAGALRRELYR
jgi:heme exporter protein A